MPLREGPRLGRSRSGRSSSRAWARTRTRSSKTPAGASWKKPNWPIAANGELVSALDGNWGTIEKAVGDKLKAKAAGEGRRPSREATLQQATRDSVRAIMLIRAYRMRGHLHANLDPLGLEPRATTRSCIPRPTASAKPTGTADLHRPRARPRIRDHPRDRRDPEAHLLLDPRRRVHAHLRSGAEGLDPGAHRGRRQGDHLHPRRQARDPQQADRGRGLREVPRRQIHRHQALRPRRRRIGDTRRWSRSSSAAARSACARSCSAWPIAAASTCSPR